MGERKKAKSRRSGGAWLKETLIALGVAFSLFVAAQIALDAAFRPETTAAKLGEAFEAAGADADFGGSIRRVWLPRPALEFRGARFAAKPNAQGRRAWSVFAQKARVSWGYVALLAGQAPDAVEVDGADVDIDLTDPLRDETAGIDGESASGKEPGARRPAEAWKKLRSRLPNETVFRDADFSVRLSRYFSPVKIKGADAAWRGALGAEPKARFEGELSHRRIAPTRIRFEGELIALDTALALRADNGFFSSKTAGGTPTKGSWGVDAVYDFAARSLTAKQLRVSGSVNPGAGGPSPLDFELKSDGLTFLPNLMSAPSVDGSLGFASDQSTLSVASSLSNVRLSQDGFTAESAGLRARLKNDGRVFVASARFRPAIDLNDFSAVLSDLIVTGSRSDADGSNPLFRFDLAGQGSATADKIIDLDLTGSFDSKKISGRARFEPDGAAQRRAQSLPQEPDAEAQERMGGTDAKNATGETSAAAATATAKTTAKTKTNSPKSASPAKGAGENPAGVSAQSARPAQKAATVAFDGAESETAEQKIDRLGALPKVFRQGRWTIDARLADLDLTPYLLRMGPEEYKLEDLDKLLPLARRAMGKMGPSVAQGRVEIGKINANGLKINAFGAGFRLDRDALALDNVACGAYGGTFSGSLKAERGAKEPRFSIEQKFDKVDAHRLLSEWIDYGDLQGIVEGAASATAQGETLERWRPTLGGSAVFKLRNGAYRGIALGAVFRPKSLSWAYSPFQSWGDDKSQVTRFNLFSFPIRWVAGVGYTNNMFLKAPGYALLGKGAHNLRDGRLDYSLTLRGDAPLGADGLSVLPLRVTGTAGHPKYSLDYSEITKNVTPGQSKEKALRHFIGAAPNPAANEKR